MERRDYILRVIERIGQFLIALRRAIAGGDAGSAAVERQLRDVAREAGLDLDIARVATPESIRLLIAPSGELEPARCWLCAEALYLDALNAELSGRPDDAWSSYGKARSLFSLVGPRGAFLVGFPEAADRIREIDDRMAGLHDPDDDPPGTGLHARRVRASAVPRRQGPAAA